MSDKDNTNVLIDDNMQRLAHMRGHIINIFKALNNIQTVMESIQLRMTKIEEDIIGRKDDIEALKECLTHVEAKIAQFNESIHHNNEVLEAFFDI